MLGNLYDVVARLVKRAMGERIAPERFFASLSIILYGAAGIIDAKGLATDWLLLAIRAAYLVAALTAYTGYTWEDDPDYLVDTVGRSDF